MRDLASRRSDSFGPAIIGGMFGLADPLPGFGRLVPFVDPSSIWLASGRAALALVIERVAPRTVWLPSFICRAVVDTVVKRARSAFYEVDEGLRVSSRVWLSDVQAGDLVVVVNYFGQRSGEGCIAEAHGRRAWVLEDACQALLTVPTAPPVDFRIVSPRKFVGVPDGGILTFGAAFDGSLQTPEQPPADWWLTALRASLGRRDADRYGAASDWFETFREAEANFPDRPYAMSTLSKSLLTSAFDYEAIAARRLANYRSLTEALGEFAVYPSLPPGVVPLGCPIRVPERDRLRSILFEHGVYPAVHWPLEGLIPESFQASHRLSTTILTLPCDQRYGRHEMEFVRELVLEGIRR